MYKEDLFDKHLKNEYLILKLLYLSSKELKKIKICEILQISLPTLSRLTDNLKSQLEEEIKTKKIKFIIKRNTLELKVINNTSIDELAEILLKNSIKYKVFRYFFDHHNVTNIQLGNYLQVSSTTLTRIISSCNDMLTDYNLKIEHGRIVGSTTQYIFFFYNFFWVSSVKKKTDSFLIKELTNGLSKKFDLSLVQKEQVNLWLTISLKKIGKLSIKDLTETELRNIEQCMSTPIHKYIHCLYKKNVTIYTEENAQLISYLLCLFLISFGVISYEKIQLGLFRRENPAFEITSKIMAATKTTFILENLTQILSVETGIFSLISQTYYFSGPNYTTDSLTLSHYYSVFKNSFREKFVSEVIDNIIVTSHLFNDKKIEYLKKGLIFFVYLLSPIKKYQVKIGVVSTGSTLITESSMCLLKNKLNIKQDVVVFPYNENENFDLVISNVSNNLLKKNYRYFYQLTTMVAKLDVEALIKIVGKISLEKYQSFSIL